MDTFKTKIVLEKNHSLDLENLPFKKGDEIEIVINPINKKKTSDYELHGTPYKYTNPLEPAIEPEDWEVNIDTY